MSESQEPKIRQLMSNDNARFIARFCRTPRTTAEVVRETMRYSKSTNLDLYERIVADNLVAMEQNKAIAYSEGKWKTTEITLVVLEKYFGKSSL